MIYQITLKLLATETVDLTDYGHDENVKWEDLTEQEQSDITDGLREQNNIPEISDVKEL